MLSPREQFTSKEGPLRKKGQSTGGGGGENTHSKQAWLREEQGPFQEAGSVIMG